MNTKDVHLMMASIWLFVANDAKDKIAKSGSGLSISREEIMFLRNLIEYSGKQALEHMRTGVGKRTTPLSTKTVSS
jgi:hypothetical protein